MRKPRELRQGASYHVIARINREERIFNSTKTKELFMQIVRKAKNKYSFAISNFCIMGNHVHFIIKPLGNENLSKIMQWMLSIFATRFNKRFGYKGHVWYDRFTSKIIRSYHQYIKTFIYIAQNPVRAGIVNHATSYHYNGISLFQKGILDILERPPNVLLKMVWPQIRL